MSDPKDRWIETLAGGRSFMDVGGLGGICNERASLALRAGARTATVADITPLDDPAWVELAHWCDEHDARAVGHARLDILEPPDNAAALVHDMVHCAGLVYHVPEPFRMLRQLRRLTREYLILTAMVVPEQVHHLAGTVRFTSDQAAFVPTLTHGTRQAISQHFEQLGVQAGGVNRALDAPWYLPDGSADASRWWWLMSPTYLQGMLEVAGFTVRETCWSWEQRAMSFLAQCSDATDAPT